MSAVLDTDIARHIWRTRYRAVGEAGIKATWRRVARAAASVETGPGHAEVWQRRFESILTDFRFLPAGRILAGAGSGRHVTLFNCFVMGAIGDTLPEIFGHLRECALTLQQGGGIGVDFSTLRPAGRAAERSGTTASGPVPFIHVWNAMCQAMEAAGNRRGAMMATLDCRHPDIEAFIEAKRTPGVLGNCNLSVLVTDAFVKAVRDDADWPLRFPVDGGADACTVSSTPARSLWRRITEASRAGSEPGMLFIDTINRENNLGYCESIRATNPCGEAPLPPYGACNLGSLNLTRFVIEPFTPSARIDLPAVADITATAVRLLDNIIDLSEFPLAAQAEQGRASRRIGLGLTGLADALIMLGLDYRSSEAREMAAGIVTVMRDSAYCQSTHLAREKGAFGNFREEAYLQQPFICRLPSAIRQQIADHGMRNSHLLAIAPTGTISLLAGNVSSGIEPVFAPAFRRRVRTGEGSDQFDLENAACRCWRQLHGHQGLPPALVCADRIDAETQLAMMATLQPLIDGAISKTVQLENADKQLIINEIGKLFHRAHQSGLKGLTVHAPAGQRGDVLVTVGGCTRRGQEECG
jgi:ribonucleoside-diphosphate reductase alpha chain